MFVIPESDYISGSLCKWNGLGNIGCGVQCKTWIGNCDKLGVYVHELGHNYGLHHSAISSLTPLDVFALAIFSLFCASSIDTDFKGPVTEYGDPTSIMGNLWWSSDRVFYFTAPHRIQNQWIDSDRVKQVNQDGVYSLAPMNRLPHRGDPQAITLLAPDMLYLNPQPFYVLSYSTGDKAVYSGRLLLHVFYNASTNSALIWTFDQPGALWRDPSVSFSIRLLSSTSERLYIDVKFGCQLSATTLTLTAPASTSATRAPLYIAQPLGSPVVLNSSEVLEASRSLRLARASWIRASNEQVRSPKVDTLFLEIQGDGVNATRYIGYMQDFSRKLNVTLLVYNRDSPVCTPTFYTYQFVSIPAGWTVVCDPSTKILLVGDQQCPIRCLITTPTISRSSASPQNFSIVMALNGANGSFSSPVRSGFHEILFIYPFQCQRLTPAVWIADPLLVASSSLSSAHGTTAAADLARLGAIASPPSSAVTLETLRSNASGSGVSVFVAFRNSDSSSCDPDAALGYSRSFTLALSPASRSFWAIDSSSSFVVNVKPQSLVVLSLSLKPIAGFQNDSIDSFPLSFLINETTLFRAEESVSTLRPFNTSSAVVNVLPPCDDVPMVLELIPDPGPPTSASWSRTCSSFR